MWDWWHRSWRNKIKGAGQNKSKDRFKAELSLREKERLDIENEALRDLKMYDLTQVWEYFNKMYKKMVNLLINDNYVVKEMTKGNSETRSMDYTFVKEKVESWYHVMHVLNKDPILYNEFRKKNKHETYGIIDYYTNSIDFILMMKSSLNQNESSELIDLFSCIDTWVYFSRHQMNYLLNMFEWAENTFFNENILQSKISLWNEEDLPPTINQKVIDKRNPIKIYGDSPYLAVQKTTLSTTVDKLEEAMDPAKPFFDAFMINNIHTFNNRRSYESEFFERK